MHYIVKGKKIKEFNKVRRHMDGFPFMYIISVADLGEGPEPSLHPSPPPPNSPTNFFLDTGPPRYLKVCVTGPPPFLKVWIRH